MRKDIERRPSGNRAVPFSWLDDFLALRSFDMRPMIRAPDIDIDETDKEYVICADLPGVSKSDIKVDAIGNQITISAIRHWDRQDDQTEEQGQQTYQRSLSLPAGIETDKIEADYTDGVLKITVPKGENLRSRRIQIGEGKGFSEEMG